MKTDEQFAADIAQGHSFEMELYGILSQYLWGLEPPAAPDYLGEKVIGGFGYQPDMKVASAVAAKSTRGVSFFEGFSSAVECKIRLGEFRFTGSNDYPFPDIIVNEVYKTSPEHLTDSKYLSLGIKDQLAYMRPFHSYWIANSERTHVAVICPATKPLWFQKETYSWKDKRKALNWHCPLQKPGGGSAVFFGRFPQDVPQLLTRL